MLLEEVFQTSLIRESVYFLASFLFILALGGLSQVESSRKGNYYGMFGMFLAIVASFYMEGWGELDYLKLSVAFILGGTLGLFLAIKISMEKLPQMVAVLHSFVGMAATIVGFAEYYKLIYFKEEIDDIKSSEIFIAVFIGAITLSGSVVAYLKLDEKIDSKPLILCGWFRHALNGIALFIISLMGFAFILTLNAVPLYIICFISLLLGIHLVMAIGGADMPVVVSMLNSYSGWATAAAGFMLDNYLLIICGALIGSSGAILSYIMCKAMNRSFVSVIAGGFGLEQEEEYEVDEKGDFKLDEKGKKIKKDRFKGQTHREATAEQVVDEFLLAKSILIVPGFGMAQSKAQAEVGKISLLMNKLGKTCLFGIHTVAGRMPGHMNVLLNEVNVPYYIQKEEDDINKIATTFDVAFIIGANDIVNPDALDNPKSPIAGMPVIQVWKAKKVYVNKRSMGNKGYSAIDNPLFFKQNCSMLLGDGKKKTQEMLTILEKRGITLEMKQEDAKKLAEGPIQVEEDVEEDMSAYAANKKVLSVPKETFENEKRVALVPQTVKQLTKKGFKIQIEKDAGLEAGFPDATYVKAGAVIVDKTLVWEQSHLVVKVRCPSVEEAKSIKSDILIAQIYPQDNKDAYDVLLQNQKLDVFALEKVPRTTYSQKLDTLSSMLGLNGYRAIIEAYRELPKISRMHITAAGKFMPTKVFILGCGVAGLQAITTAKNLGAIVRAFDARPECKEQAESLGAEFLVINTKESGAGTGGYAKQVSEEYKQLQLEMNTKQAKECDIIITTALIPGIKAPILVTKEMARLMKPGSVIVDMAAERGGNCELTVPGKMIVDEESGVKIIGYTDLPSRMAKQASEFWSVNLNNLLEEFIRPTAEEAKAGATMCADNFKINLDDDQEIQNNMCIINQGQARALKKREQKKEEKKEEKKDEKKEEQVKEQKDVKKEEQVQEKKEEKKDDKKEIDTEAEKKKKEQQKKDGEKYEEFVEKAVEKAENKAEELTSYPIFVAGFVTVLALIIAICIGVYTRQDFILQFGIFILAIFIGYMVIWNVTHCLHSPLMSLTNALSGIIIVGCMQTMAQGEDQDPFFRGYSILAWLGLFFASINCIGGFIVTHRILEMFVVKTDAVKKQPDEKHH